MTDVHEPDIRSYNMSQIHGKDTKPELMVRKHLHSQGFRFRLHDAKLPGKPDVLLKKYDSIIFIHGCFWHGHEGCRYFKIPGTRAEWWSAKIERNIQRDKDSVKKLQELGWTVFVIWECDLKPKQRSNTLETLTLNLKDQQSKIRKAPF
jgi:DNA mismatch endonuclease (patch repair protein)